MPSLLSRFKRSPSTSSSLSAGTDKDNLTSPNQSVASSPVAIESGSRFVENLSRSDLISPSKGYLDTPDDQQPLPSPGSAQSRALGTPKLVLTEEGSNSPRSFSSSPQLNLSPTKHKGIGLGIKAQPASSTSLYSESERSVSSASEEATTPRNNEVTFPSMQGYIAPPIIHEENLSVHSAPIRRPRANSDASSAGKKSRRGSVVSRVVQKLGNSPGNSPTDSLAPPIGDDHQRRKRSKSGSSGKSGQAHSIAALAKSGLHVANQHGGTDELLSPTMSTSSRRSVNRSPWLVRNEGEGSPRGDREDQRSRNEVDLGDEDDEDDDESDSDFYDHLGVTGFAVASNKRNADFHSLFPTVDEGDYLIDDYGCALSKDILVQGRFYVSENHICFHANIFGWITDLVIPFSDIRVIEKKMTALVIPNAIGIATAKEKASLVYTFASFISRDTTYDVLMNVWRLCNPTAVMSTSAFSQVNGGGSRRSSVVGEEQVATKEGEKPVKGHPPTQCTDGKEGRHYAETCLTTTFPSTPEKIYNLMFNSVWYKNFLVENQKLKDIETSDWRPISEGNILLTRSTSYIKPLTASIGPKQTRCHIVDECDNWDPDSYISMITTTRTPEVPSGSVFSVKTRSCFMWAGGNSTKVVVTTTVEWTGKSWVKGIIEKSAIEGQRQYHDDLEAGMRGYIKEHPTEFAGEDGLLDEDVVVEEEKKAQPTEAEAYAAEARKKRHEQDYAYLSGALDTVISSIKMIFSALKTIFETLSDIVSDTPLTKEVILGSIIALLVLSNIYTYFAFRSTSASPERRARRLAHGHGTDDDVIEAMRMMLQKSSLDKPRGDIREEASELSEILDQVEKRAERLRGLLQSAVGGGQL